MFLVAGLAYLALRSYWFLAQAGYPSGYFYDLGVNVLATSQQDATIHSLADLLDSIGWNASGDAPQFRYNPLTTSWVLVAISKLGAGVQLGIKLLMVGEFWVALVSMAVLYRDMRRSWLWALVAGLLYALFPSTVLQISGNLDLGFSAALAPFALAIGLRLVRRFGNFGLPLAGAICGYVGQGFATEYLLVISFPLYLAVALRAYSARTRIAWTAGFVGGGLCAIGVGLFCIVPTFASNSLLTSPASRIAESEAGSTLALFGESIAALWHGVLTESMLSPLPEFNVTSQLWSTSVALTILWGSAIAFVVRAVRRRGEAKRLGLFVATLIAFAFGSSLPFVATFWDLIAHVPFLQLLRTPDRLTLVPFIFVVLWGVAMLQSLSRTRLSAPRNVARFFPISALIVAGASFAYFDFAAGALIVRPNLDYRLPDLAATNAVTVRQPRPLAAYAFVNEGSVLDTPLYGAGVPTRIIAQDLISRFSDGPAHALGVLRKAGIATLVTTPVWSTDGQGWPDLGVAYATSRWAIKVAGSTSGPAVWHLRDSMPDVSQTELACLHGGPGALDEIALAPVVSRVALTTDPVTCRLDVYANTDPRDDSPRKSLAAWPGISLSAATGVQDRDYPFTTTRSLLARPWYRNAIEGDSPVFGAPAVAIADTWHTNVVVTVPARGRYVANARDASAFGLCFVATVDGGKPSVRCEPAGYGLHWQTISLALGAGRHTIAFGFRPAARPAPPNELFLDGIDLAREVVPAHARLEPRPRIVIYSIPWLSVASGWRPFWLPAGDYRAAWFAADGSVVDRNVSLDRQRETRGVDVARSGFHRIGPPPDDAEFVAFFENGIQGYRPVQSVGRRRSATDWDVTLGTHGAIRATVLDDHSWYLDGGGRRFAGFDCDLVDTCFGDVPPGHYVLHHSWPASIVIGFLASALAWGVGAALCALEVLRGRSRKDIA